ncbi:4036_t:CDS:2 [Funneliformis geosporum]|uniref:tRNA-splicing endonuclease subunit Sen2 n=1 Tax=Funneliformis geosporum TaxID=1117311 RepID=A0A9W4X1N3_9GLOM|nr:4036_t:CDS:2 [Funneliformis geosporum]CAI2179849.1 14605_t:CDS:2 [Funneliformis geosporum]
MSDQTKTSLTSGPTKKTSYKAPLPLSLSPSLLSRFISFLLPTTTKRIKGKFDEKSQAVIISNREDMEQLWKEGFFGKGSLSRSEPTWFWRNNNGKKGKGKQKLSAEQVTEQRRIARKRYKKAKQAQNVGEVQQAIIIKEDVKVINMESENTQETTIEKLTQEDETILSEDIENLILTTQEAFFLSYGLGIIDIYDSQDNLLSLEECWKSFYTISNKNLNHDDYDNVFIIRYVVYHYFRSLGWVVRCGMKFGVDYVLYEKGPVFKHSEYAVIILPIHSSQDSSKSLHSSDNLLIDYRSNCTKSWSWMMNLNRVCVQVKKV